MLRQSSALGKGIKTVLPNGTNYMSPGPSGDENDIAPWSRVPVFPPDLFAVTGYLCQVGGVVSYFEPSLYRVPEGDYHFTLSRKDRDAVDIAARRWRKRSEGKKPENELPCLVRFLWEKLIGFWNEPLTPGSYMDNSTGEPAQWWKYALMLHMIADIACNRVLRDKIKKYGKSSFENWILAHYDLLELEANERNKEFRPPASLTHMIDTAVVCVLPKMRVPPVGATLRNASRNLALLPGRGEVRCHWYNIGKNDVPSEDDETLDVLLIPEPRSIQACSFEAEDNGDEPRAKLHHNKWNWENFHLRQDWIGSSKARYQFVENCKKLLIKAREETRRVNAVILPEYAVDYNLFDLLCGKLKKIEPNLEFMIAGSSSNCHGEEGKHVVTRLWHDQDKPDSYSTKSRRKHHRWRMDRGQIENYGLSAVLNPKVPNWWETTPLGRRELHFYRFRKASAFSVLICEELARSDPCHGILRSVAPNLIFALLLDGPQIKQRWPAQYASNLADDPGSSVLTFTSYGLIDRSNRQGKFGTNHCIAMWKDDGGNFVEIPMPSGSGPRGVLLSLWPEHTRDITITGKRSEERSWRYSAHFPIVLDEG